ncbi:tachylectin-related carbohydrate-binding protein [Trichocoleus sp. ST-U3]
MTDEIKVCSVPVFADTNGFSLTGMTPYLWENGKTLRVRFLDGDPVVHAKVEQVAHQWSKFANIKFRFGNDPDAEIRISFTRSGSWSMLGTGALQVARSEPTMNFGWLTPTSSDEEYSRVVLHEFGHALGFTHEHKHPEAGIKWNRAAVIDYYRRTNGWDEETTVRNVLQAESKDETQYSNFDRESIMLYAIPAQLTTDGFSVGWNTQLSAIDKQFAQILYPFDESFLTGDLLWYQHDGWQDGTGRWKGAKKVGNGWQNFKSVFASSNGIVYAIEPNGDLQWYQHDGWQDGSGRWKGAKKVGNGWQNFKSVFASSNGIVYAIEPNGDLQWYQHDGWQDGTGQWKGAKKVGNGWQNFKSVFATSNGIIYAIEPNGDLQWYQHDGWQDGTGRWKGAKKVGNGWQNFKSVFATSNGIIYGIHP